MLRRVSAPDPAPSKAVLDVPRHLLVPHAVVAEAAVAAVRLLHVEDDAALEAGWQFNSIKNYPIHTALTIYCILLASKSQ